MRVLVFNSGSSTLKFALFDDAVGSEAQLRGLIEDFGPQATLSVQARDGLQTLRVDAGDHAAAAAAALDQLRGRDAQIEDGLVVAHRLVHDGGRYPQPLRLSAQHIDALDALTPLAPLHMPPALAAVRRVHAALGDEVPSYAVFDTAFFHALPAAVRTYALPQALNEQHGLRRYGFHGLAHRSLYQQLCAHCGSDRLRAITLQLGQGCSAAAIDAGRAIDTSMGYTPLEGLVMGTRPGDVDAGVLLQLLRNGLTVDELDRQLQRHSGLLGVSASSADMRRLLSAERDGDARAQLAIDVFCHRLRKYLGAYLAVLGGADAIVFGGGIGSHAAEIRRRCLQDFEWAGLHLDRQRNEAGQTRISTDASHIHAYVFATDEERVIADDALAALRAAA